MAYICIYFGNELNIDIEIVDLGKETERTGKKKNEKQTNKAKETIIVCDSQHRRKKTEAINKKSIPWNSFIETRNKTEIMNFTNTKKKKIGCNMESLTKWHSQPIFFSFWNCNFSLSMKAIRSHFLPPPSYFGLITIVHFRCRFFVQFSFLKRLAALPAIIMTMHFFIMGDDLND